MPSIMNLIHGQDQIASPDAKQAAHHDHGTPEFECYTDTSKHYDTTRVPAGADRVLSRLKSTDALLDVGCGTGNYLMQLAPSVKRACGMEFNPGMLGRFREKLSDAPKEKYANIELQQGSLLERIPYDDATFDVVVCTQVLHHLDHGAPFTGMRHAIGEMARVLKPGGTVYINHSTPKQAKEGYWWARLIPQALEKISVRFLTNEVIEEAFRDAGMELKKHEIVPEPLQGPGYFNFAGVFSEQWRNTDSTWRFVSAQELESAKSNMERMMKDGSLGKFVSDCERDRIEIGQSVWSIATKTEQQQRRSDSPAKRG